MPIAKSRLPRRPCRAHARAPALLLALAAACAATGGRASPAADGASPAATHLDTFDDGGPRGLAGPVRLVRPPGAAAELVMLFSDTTGFGDRDAALAAALAKRGLLVAGIDLATYLRAIDAWDGACFYAISELEDLARRIERQAGFDTYRGPLLVGRGDAGTFVYAALAQAPAATIGGAVSVAPAETFPSRMPLCEGAPATATATGTRYGPRPDLPGRLTLVLAPADGPWRAHAAHIHDVVVHALEPSPGDGTGLDAEVAEVVTAAGGLAPTGGDLSDLPLTELPARAHPVALAIVLSGDGGWRDLDAEIGAALSTRERADVAVVGLDSLRYFWRERDAGTLARDLVRIADHYGARWGTDTLVLIGYSFGAGVLPAAVNRLPASTLARVREISLLGVEERADWTIHVAGWLGRAPTGTPLAPELARLDRSLVQCFYGAEEDDSLCPAAAFDGAERIRTGGGHHFDGDYDALARRIRVGLDARLAAHR